MGTEAKSENEEVSFVEFRRKVRTLAGVYQIGDV